MKQLVKCVLDGLKNEDGLIFSPEDCETIAVNVVQLKCGQVTEPAIHTDEEEVYIVVSGRGIVRLDGVPYSVSEGNVVYIPRNTEHIIEGTSEEWFTYVCVANWPDVIPAAPEH